MSDLTFRVHPSVASIAEAEWESLRDDAWTPFQERAWMLALEEAGCASPERGWTPMHMALWRGRDLVALAPAYARVDSQGEFVFDHAWAGAAQRARIAYYPKLTLAVPFTPCTGRRIYTRPGEDRAALSRTLARGIFDAAKHAGLSSVHALFVTDDEAQSFEAEGAFVRHGVQFHWENPGYRGYDDYLSRFTSRRRKTLRREADAHIDQGISIRTRRGDALARADAAMIHRLYVSTVDKFAWGRRYLTPRFFERALDSMRGSLELVEAVRDGAVVAGAFNVASKTHLYGRYWGCFEEHPFLHFAVCYYHSIGECIRRGVRVFEGGAGGEHKLSRGFVPTVTRSAHRVFAPGLERAIRDFVARERAAIEQELPAVEAEAGLKPWTPAAGHE